MNKIILIIATLLFSCTGFANNQNFKLDGENYVGPHPSPYSFDFIDSNKLRIKWASSPDSRSFDSSQEYSYSIDQSSGLPFVILDKSIPRDISVAVFGADSVREYGNKFLFLVGQDPKESVRRKKKFHHQYAVGYSETKDKNNSNVIIQDIRNFQATPRKYRDASSTYTEPGYDFGIANLNKLESDKPWVEGVKGHGIGESFIIEHFNYKYDYLFIINGFISVEKPFLYKENSRIKKIKVEGVDSKESVICEVLDTPHPQTVDISKLNNIEDLKITILEVYEGDKYDDTVIHYLITWDKEILPFTNSTK